MTWAALLDFNLKLKSYNKNNKNIGFLYIALTSVRLNTPGAPDYYPGLRYLYK